MSFFLPGKDSGYFLHFEAFSYFSVEPFSQVFQLLSESLRSWISDDFHGYHPHPLVLPVWEPLVAPLGAPDRSIALHLAPNISQDSPTCSQDRPRQPNLQPRSPKTAQLGLNMAILVRFSPIWLPSGTHKSSKTLKNLWFFEELGSVVEAKAKKIWPRWPC